MNVIHIMYKHSMSAPSSTSSSLPEIVNRCSPIVRMCIHVNVYICDQQVLCTQNTPISFSVWVIQYL